MDKEEEKPEVPSKVISLEEVEKHASRESCWLIIEGNVYDVTDYMDDHPGGGDVLLDASGRDATDDFNDVGHSKTAVSYMKKYLIGAFEEGVGGAKASRTGSTKQTSGGIATLLQILLPILIALIVLGLNNGYLENPFNMLK
mmetsp:Transcript_22570/g.31428  ORF Transcript_22570/g.31428 Transcript_22570/m.31428 type:complete len:142 (-) Transcript_22570:242-667(-)|eukprot:CAMPEP_0196573394 /NCGR_PEP_ID=MMETSP1081-20130531/3303_1 /TAXON_ID=36882 /ORGANISM="Pyramimonas amylifera, Strain CCMP720" /LENGTH=141 /DNA_ID=CAMNT_0041891081 /DNA_START=68 /DNA_END=493 /DNA_ORIENTATION=-